LQPSKLAKRTCFLFLLLLSGFYLYGLGRFPLVGPDEPRYAEVAREMLQRHDPITPTLGGHVWFEKPALLYWMMMASFHLFGVSEAAARLGPAICGLLTFAAVYWLTRRREKNDSAAAGEACWTTLVTASTLGIIVFSRGASSDIVLTMTITWALVLFLGAELEKERSPGYRQLISGFYAFVGLSLLAKGLVGLVLPIGVIAVYLILRRQLPSRRLLSSLTWGLPLMVAVSAIWYGPVLYRHGWLFIDDFFIQHHVLRYFTNKYHHPQPIYHYLIIVPVMTLPWTAFLFASLGTVKRRDWRSDNADDRLRTFALAWLVFPLVFFSLSSSKLPGYILPVLPAAALLAGDRLNGFLNQESGRRAMRFTGALFLLLGVAASVYVFRLKNLSAQCAFGVVAPLFVAGAFAVISRSRRMAALLVICGLLTSLMIVLNCAVTPFARRESVRDLLVLAERKGYGSAPLYMLHEVDRTAEFYATGRIVYGADGEPLRLEGADQVRVAVRAAGKPILVLVPLVYVYQLTQLTTTRAEVLGDNGRMAIVAVAEN